jgi:N-acetylneuraminic acid mutarotase
MGMAGTIGGKLYVGQAQSNVLLVYDPPTNTWAERETSRVLRGGAAFATLGARLYMIGGFRYNADGTFSEVRATNAYDPAANTWTNLAQLPAPRSGMVANRVVLNEAPRIQLVGGPRPGNNLQYIP